MFMVISAQYRKGRYEMPVYEILHIDNVENPIWIATDHKVTLVNVDGKIQCTEIPASEDGTGVDIKIV